MTQLTYSYGLGVALVGVYWYLDPAFFAMKEKSCFR